MNNTEKELRNTLNAILDQVESLSPAEQQEFWDTLPEMQRPIMETMMQERAMMDGIAATFQEAGVTSIQFGADDDPEGYKIDLVDKRYE